MKEIEIELVELDDERIDDALYYFDEADDYELREEYWEYYNGLDQN